MTAPLPLPPDELTALDTGECGVSSGRAGLTVMGRAGSGTSTLLDVARLLRQPPSGRVFINGPDTSGSSPAPQPPSRKNITLPRELDSRSRSLCRAAAEQALAKAGRRAWPEGGRLTREARASPSAPRR